MVSEKSFTKHLGQVLLAGCIAIGVSVASESAAVAATTIDGPIDLGTATTFGVLGGSTVTNTGLTVVNGDVGVSAGSSITGFEGPPAGLATGTIHRADEVASEAQLDLTTAINAAASLTPTTSGLANLSGMSLTPGVYSGGELSLNSGGLLTLAGTAESIWVFQASSTLTVGSGSQIQMTGGASSCNVFWEVGSSATIGTNADFVGTVMANTAVTANTGATIRGRLLASTAAVTLDNNFITAPTGCEPASTPVETDSPAFTSTPPASATVGTPYTHTVTATGTPAPTYSVTGGELPTGLELDSATGVISGTPTAPGQTTVTITASNGVTPVVSSIVTFETSAADAPAATGPGSRGIVPPTAGPGSRGIVPPTNEAAPTAELPINETPFSAERVTNGATSIDELAATGTETEMPAVLSWAAALMLVGVFLLIGRRTKRARGRVESPAGR
ncbi:ice-binding family protein [Mycetocola zhadangensis]|uniref:ice-binding family protein n=1 Tax=Mycetocola zhadangensis TaxID=1164595 RepID=UPI0011C45664|nr:ice-binding family protein [Mycetocola zhadangensis]